MTNCADEDKPGESRKRPLETEDNASEEDKYSKRGNEPLLKLLVPRYAIGALLGKGGALLNELKNTYGAHIRISSGREFYPGSRERVVVLTGEIYQIIDLNKYIMGKIADPGREPENLRSLPIHEDRAQKVKIVLTNQAAGLLIGRGGLTIKSIQEGTKAKISISMIDIASVPGERVLTMSGSFEERSNACRQILEIIADDPSNMANTKLRYTDGDTRASHVAGAGNTGINKVGSNYRLKGKVEVQIQVPDELVGPIMGKQGAIIKDMVQRTGGARFKFSEKSESINRTLMIIGNMDQAHIAHDLVNRRVGQLGNYPHIGFNSMGEPYRLNAKVSVELDVPGNLVKSIMGQQGSAIKDMIQRSGGAKMDFNFFDRGWVENRKLTISGNMDQVHIAYKLVNQRVEYLESQLDNLQPVNHRGGLLESPSTSQPGNQRVGYPERKSYPPPLESPSYSQPGNQRVGYPERKPYPLPLESQSYSQPVNQRVGYPERQSYQPVNQRVESQSYSQPYQYLESPAYPQTYSQPYHQGY